MAKSVQKPKYSRIKNPWQTIKKAYFANANLEFLEGLGELLEMGGEFLGGIASSISGLLIYKVLKNPNLNFFQKMLPTIFLSVALALGVTAAVIAIAGAATLVPIFVFVGSVAATIRKMGQYLSSRRERKNLRKEMISQKEVVSQIEKLRLDTKSKLRILDYTLKAQEIYASFYHARDLIIKHKNISLGSKNKLVEKLNGAIENFSKGESGRFELKMMGLPIECQMALEKTNEKIMHYAQAKTQVEKMLKDKTISPPLFKRIQVFKNTREKIAAQDLPESLKAQIYKILDEKKLSKDSLSLLYASVGSHYLNITADQQLEAKDSNLYAKILKLKIKESDFDILRAYHQYPRSIYAQLKALSEHIDKKALATELQALMIECRRDPANVLKGEWQSLEEKLIKEGLAKLPEIQFLRGSFKNYEKIAAKFEKLNLMTEEIKENQRLGLEHFANLGLQFPSPNIEQGKKKPKNKNQKGLGSDLKMRFYNTFQILEKKERLNMLETVVPRHLGQVFTCAAISLVSFFTSLLIPALASPAAPVAAGAMVGLGALSGALTVAITIDSIDVIRRDLQSEYKMESVKKDLTKGVEPGSQSHTLFSEAKPEIGENRRWNINPFYNVKGEGEKKVETQEYPTPKHPKKRG